MNDFSGYRFMWAIVLFDLPVLNKGQRKKATGFRNHLLDLGFQMAQYSVYMKFCGTRDALNTLTKRIMREIPSSGKVSIISITDKQYGSMKVFVGRTQDENNRERKQLLLL
jgi:CRISPR-associated protein Cas2